MTSASRRVTDGVGAAVRPLQGEHVQPRPLGDQGERLRLHQRRRSEPVGLPAHLALRRRAGLHVAEGLVDDLVGFVEHGVLGRPVPQVLAVVDVVAAPRGADVDALHAFQVPALDRAEAGLFQQAGQLRHGGATRHAEVAHEAGGQPLRVQGVLGGVVVQQAAAEVFPRHVHSSNLLPVNRSYISTMYCFRSSRDMTIGKYPSFTKCQVSNARATLPFPSWNG